MLLTALTVQWCCVTILSKYTEKLLKTPASYVPRVTPLSSVLCLFFTWVLSFIKFNKVHE